MPPVWIEGYAVGPTSRKGEPCAPRELYPKVLAVPAPDIGRFLGSSDRRKLTAHLRMLKSRGVLVCPLPQRLNAKVRGWDCRAYLFDVGSADDVPRIRTRRARIIQL